MQELDLGLLLGDCGLLEKKARDVELEGERKQGAKRGRVRERKKRNRKIDKERRERENKATCSVLIFFSMARVFFSSSSTCCFNFST